jgi:polyhydroxybutyrate depolymerase
MRRRLYKQMLIDRHGASVTSMRIEQNWPMRVRRLMLALLLAAGPAACADDDGGTAATSSSPTATTVSDAGPGDESTTSTVAVPPSTSPSLASSLPPPTFAVCGLPEDGMHPITSHGVERAYLTRRAADPGAGPLPVLVLLHGHGGSAERFSATSGVADRAAAGGVLLVAPQGQGDPAGWEIPNWAADAQFVNDVLDTIGESGCAATSAVWVAGHSAGSAFAAYYGCTNTDRVAGVWLNAGLPPPLCADRSPAVVISHGTADPVVPFTGGDQNASDRSFVLKPVPDSAQEWAQTAGCQSVDGPVPRNAVGIMTWQGCTRGPYVRLYTIEGGGHTWPGAAGESAGAETTNALAATCLLVESVRIGTAQPADPAMCTAG